MRSQQRESLNATAASSRVNDRHVGGLNEVQQHNIRVGTETVSRLYRR